MPARQGAFAAGLAVVLFAYVASYYRLVDPGWLLNPVPGEPAVTADYKVGDVFARWTFHPMNVLDRRLRPAWWAGFPATPPWQQPER